MMTPEQIAEIRARWGSGPGLGSVEALAQIDVAELLADRDELMAALLVKRDEFRDLNPAGKTMIDLLNIWVDQYKERAERAEKAEARVARLQAVAIMSEKLASPNGPITHSKAWEETWAKLDLALAALEPGDLP